MTDEVRKLTKVAPSYRSSRITLACNFSIIERSSITDTAEFTQGM